MSHQKQQQHGELPVCRAGIRRDRSLRVPPRTQPLDCQAADSTAAILWRKKKKKKSPYRFNGLRGFLRKGANKATIPLFYTSFPNVDGLRGGEYEPNSDNTLIFIVVAVFHGVCAITSSVQHNMASKQRLR
ncbi:Hypothetical predicted protein [Scomber scombrus]|uniref:Uncharacterized protein n=1 Tax=Scomber scombrus TaxID=13677 RepID=A0AAV1Q6D2_SCOSC